MENEWHRLFFQIASIAGDIAFDLLKLKTKTPGAFAAPGV